MESEDGHVFIKNLAHFIHTHEQALANAYHQRRGSTASDASASSSLTDLLSKPFANLTTSIKPSKLSLTPHHLYYLLTKYEELGVNVGVLNVRLENIHADTPGNYVSFLGQAPKRAGRPADTESLRSVSSVRSVLSNVSSIWSNFRSASKEEKKLMQHKDDLRYLYSCFTKLPALRLAPDPRSRLVSGFEEFPFDTAVPLFVFKNLSSLEICDLDFRQIYGWDALSRQLRSLTVRRGQVADALDILLDVVLDDIDRRRKRSSRAPVPTTPSTPGGSWMTSPRSRHGELSLSVSGPGPESPFTKQRSGSLVELPTTAMAETSPRQRSSSPIRPGSGSLIYINHSLEGRSSSRGSSLYRTNSRQKSVDLSAITILPSNAWQFLRHLSLADNSLHHISAASLAPVAPTLQSLDLSSNLFTEIPDAMASLSQLRALNLSNCMIESLRSLTQTPLPAVTTLNLRGNRIHSLFGLDRLYSLEKLDLRENRLQDHAELARLTGIPFISHIYVVRNPFTKTHPEYRISIFNLFRSTPGRVDDIVIDTIGPMYNEKRKLVDWTPEPPQMSVIKPATEEDEPQEDSTEAYVPPNDSAIEVPTLASPQIPSPSRRKKSSKIRVVQLAQSPTSPRRSSQLIETTSIDDENIPAPPEPAVKLEVPANAIDHAASRATQHETPPRIVNGGVLEGTQYKAPPRTSDNAAYPPLLRQETDSLESIHTRPLIVHKEVSIGTRTLG